MSEVLARPGRPLDGERREAFGSRFGCDFSAVRVHTDAAAATSARALNASAYTVGDSIVFGEGKFNQRSPDGRRLLAHELAHVAQQTSLPRLVHHPNGLTQQHPVENPIQLKATPSGSTVAVTPARLIQRAPPQFRPRLRPIRSSWVRTEPGGGNGIALPLWRSDGQGNAGIVSKRIRDSLITALGQLPRKQRRIPELQSGPA